MTAHPSPRSCPVQRRQTQHGLSLVELMVGLGIGMLVVLAALVSTAHTRQAGTTLQSAIALDRDAASVWRVMSGNLRHAGARSLRTAAGITQVEFNPLQESLTANGLATQIAGVNGAAGAPDSLSLAVDVRSDYRGGNCFGEQASGEAELTTYSLQNGELRCDIVSVTRASGNRVSSARSGGVIAGVIDLQFRYAEWSGTDLRYVDSPAVWAQVTAVEVCLHLASPANAEVDADITDCAGNTRTLSDRRLHRVYRQVFQLRNIDQR
jgi:type IV pilus assembly protein PilW